MDPGFEGPCVDSRAVFGLLFAAGICGDDVLRS